MKRTHENPLFPTTKPLDQKFSIFNIEKTYRVKHVANYCYFPDLGYTLIVESNEYYRKNWQSPVECKFHILNKQLSLVKTLIKSCDSFSVCPLGKESFLSGNEKGEIDLWDIKKGICEAIFNPEKFFFIRTRVLLSKDNIILIAGEKSGFENPPSSLLFFNINIDPPRIECTLELERYYDTIKVTDDVITCYNLNDAVLDVYKLNAQNLNTKIHLITTIKGENPIWDLKVSKDKSKLIYLLPSRITIYDLKEKKELATIRRADTNITFESVDFISDTELVVLGCNNRNCLLLFYSLSTYECLYSLKKEESSVLERRRPILIGDPARESILVTLNDQFSLFQYNIPSLKELCRSACSDLFFKNKITKAEHESLKRVDNLYFPTQ